LRTPRGFRIAKEKASKKIDSIVALAMACVAAIERGKVDPDPKELRSRETVVFDKFNPVTGEDGPPTIYRD
jgi:hypothetical protein